MLQDKKVQENYPNGRLSLTKKLSLKDSICSQTTDTFQQFNGNIHKSLVYIINIYPIIL